MEVATKAYNDQKPGTSGLRKKVTVFQQENYLANFVQSTLDSLPADKLKGSTLVVGGDGRYWVKEAAQIIIKMCAANGIARVWVGQNGLLSTPAVSAIVREREGGAAYGAFILTASHNPGGPTEDFGIKYNCENGGPAPEKVTNDIFDKTKSITRYFLNKDIPDIDLATVGKHTFGDFTVEVIDSTEDYVKLLSTVFNFDKIRALIQRKDFKMVYDGMHGVAGPYAKKVLVEILGASPESLINADPKEDFGGGHPDPNLTYAKELVRICGLTRTGEVLPGSTRDSIPDFGAAGDGDADRNMILGKQFFVTPSDSVAILAANATCIPYFANGLKAVSRSMPTSGALDRVAEGLNIRLFEVPTGWKFFGNLMDSKVLFGGEDFTPLICGEESFGTGSNHVREKDGLWAVIAWLSILAERNGDASKPLVSVQQIVEEHWAKYGRNYYSRYDYEGVESAAADKMMDGLRALDAAKANLSYKGAGIKYIDDFKYEDPVDKSVSAKQGIRVVFVDGSRFVFRLSGTGSSGATIRLYLESYEPVGGNFGKTAAESLKELVTLALETSQLPAITGRSEPTVIT